MIILVFEINQITILEKSRIIKYLIALSIGGMLAKSPDFLQQRENFGRVVKAKSECRILGVAVVDCLRSHPDKFNGTGDGKSVEFDDRMLKVLTENGSDGEAPYMDRRKTWTHSALDPWGDPYKFQVYQGDEIFELRVQVTSPHNISVEVVVPRGNGHIGTGRKQS